MQLNVQELTAACADDSQVAGVRVVAQWEPVAGRFAPVKPAIYEGGEYQRDRRWVTDGAGEAHVVDAIVIDNVASEANRLEASLKSQRDSLGLPDLVLDLSGLELPVHLPQELSAFDLPHRNADAYLRDATFNGVEFLKSDVGRAIFEGTASSPGALLQWMPQALLFGFWQSHLGKKRQQTKLARSWVSEIVGFEPAGSETKGRGLKGDPLNLSVSDAVVAGDDDETDWAWAETARKGKKSGDSLAEIGHGQVPVSGAPLGISFSHIQQSSSLSFAGLRRITAATPEQSSTARALLAALGIVAHVNAFGRAFSLRSGCDLRPVEQQWEWLGEASDEPIEVPDIVAASELFRDCVAAAKAASLPVGDGHWARVTLEPQAKLSKAITDTWPAAAGQ